MTVVRWAEIPGYEGKYMVSDHGHVKSLERQVPCRGGFRTLKERILKPKTDKEGYKIVSPCKDSKKRSFRVNRLVARAFCSGYTDGLEACHNDGNPSNNHYMNLRWATPKENSQDKVRHGSSGKGEGNPASKLADSQVCDIRTMYGSGYWSQHQLAEIFGVTQPVISRIVTRRTWKHLPSLTAQNSSTLSR